MNSTNPKVIDLKMDIDDMKSVMEIAQRQKTKDTLSLEIRRLKTELLREMGNKTFEMKHEPPKQSPNAPKCYEVKISDYGWTETDKFVKIYVPLTNVQNLPAESIVCEYTNRLLHLRVLGLDNKNHDLLIKNLCEDIVPENCFHKVKTDNVVVSLAKKQCKTWKYLTEVEKTLKEAKNTVPKMDKDEDPGSSLMNMMKKMYQDGDDDMKRVIAKAWTESQEKRTKELDSMMM